MKKMNKLVTFHGNITMNDPQGGVALNIAVNVHGLTLEQTLACRNAIENVVISLREKHPDTEVPQT